MRKENMEDSDVKESVCERERESVSISVPLLQSRRRSKGGTMRNQTDQMHLKTRFASRGFLTRMPSALFFFSIAQLQTICDIHAARVTRSLQCQNSCIRLPQRVLFEHNPPFALAGRIIMDTIGLLYIPAPVIVDSVAVAGVPFFLFFTSFRPSDAPRSHVVC